MYNIYGVPSCLKWIFSIRLIHSLLTIFILAIKYHRIRTSDLSYFDSTCMGISHKPSLFLSGKWPANHDQVTCACTAELLSSAWLSIIHHQVMKAIFSETVKRINIKFCMCNSNFPLCQMIFGSFSKFYISYFLQIVFVSINIGLYVGVKV